MSHCVWDCVLQEVPRHLFTDLPLPIRLHSGDNWLSAACSMQRWCQCHQTDNCVLDVSIQCCVQQSEIIKMLFRKVNWHWVWFCLSGKSESLVDFLGKTNIRYRLYVESRKMVHMNLFTKQKLRASLVAQRLRICLLMQGTRVRALVWEDPTCCGATRPVRHNYWACPLEPASHNYWAHVPQLLKPGHLELVLCNKRSHRNGKPAHHNKE